jgi:serine/threonine-protein kinase
MRKIAEFIDLALLEFRSLKNDDGAPSRETANDDLSLTIPSLTSLPPPSPRNSDEEVELGGLADELEGPDPTPREEESSGVAAWFQKLVR